MGMSDLQIFAHRGASGHSPENTLLAFRRAFELGVGWIELDTQLVENRLVVFHDDHLERTTNGQGLLSTLTLAELRRLDAGQGEQVPLLEEVLELVMARQAGVNIELKGPGTAAPVAQLLDDLLVRGQLNPAQLLVSSFLPTELEQFHQLRPQLRCAPIYEELPDNLEDRLASLSAWSVHLDHQLIDAALVKRITACGCRVFAWTVNDPAHAQRLAQRGVKGIFTDFPEFFVAQKS